MPITTASLARAAVRLIAPLAAGFTDAASFRRLMGRLGWAGTVLPTEYLDVGTQALALAEQVAGWAEESPDLADVLSIVSVVRTLVEDVQSLPAPTDVGDPAAFAEDLGGALVDLLLLDALTEAMPSAAAGLELLGVVVMEDDDGSGARSAHVRRRLDLDRLQVVITDPIAALRDVAGWDATDVAIATIRSLVLELLWLVPIPVDVTTTLPDARTGAAARLDLLEVPGAGSVAAHVVIADAAADGSDEGLRLELGLEVPTGAAASIPLGDLATLSVQGAVIGDIRPTLVIRPGMPPALEGVTATGADISAHVHVAPPEPLVLIGDPDGIRLELSGLDLAGGIQIGSGAELWGALGLEDFDLVIAAGDTDTFMRALLGDQELRLGSSFDLRYGTASGFSASGALGITIDMPLDLTLGPITLEHLGVFAGLKLDDTSVSLVASVVADIGAELLIFAGRVEGIGLELRVTPGDGGAPDVSFGLLGPTAVGLSIELAGVVTGGGYIYIDHEIGRYAGALSISVLSIGIDAMVVVDTRPPGGGWALFASITARFPSIQLGFGFTLTGVGGLVAINRTFDPGALALALRDGAVDAILFPDDPVNDAPAIIAQIDSFFPLEPGATVFGPVVQLGWGTPSLITAEIGVIIALPDLVIAILGSISINLPTADAPLVELNLDVLGVIDIPAGEIWAVASLYDSMLLGVISLSGDAGFYLRTSGEPYFLLTVGGYHPTFQPPAGIPAVFHNMRRMTAAVNLGEGIDVSLELYAAITSNTLQAGASLTIVVVKKILGTEYTARGWFSFDTLIQFQPFAIIVDLSAGVTVSTKRKTLCGVWLSFHLEGPKPWHASGIAEFDFFGINVNLRFDIGGHASAGALERVPVRNDVVAALRQADAWDEITPLWLRADIVIAPPDPVEAAAAADGDAPAVDLGRVVVRPDAMLAVRQTVAPLDHPMDLVGNARPQSGHERLTVTGAGRMGPNAAIGLPYLPITDWFAPAQYEQMSRRAKLTRASYEKMNSGVSFGDEGVSIPGGDDCASVDDGYEEQTWSPIEATSRMSRGKSLLKMSEAIPLSAAAHLVRAAHGGGGLRPMTPAGAPAPMVVDATRWTIVDTATGSVPSGARTAVAGGVSQHAAAMAAATLAATDGIADARVAATLRVVPHTAALQGV